MCDIFQNSNSVCVAIQYDAWGMIVGSLTGDDFDTKTTDGFDAKTTRDAKLHND